LLAEPWWVIVVATSAADRASSSIPQWISTVIAVVNRHRAGATIAKVIITHKIRDVYVVCISSVGTRADIGAIVS